MSGYVSRGRVRGYQRLRVPFMFGELNMPYCWAAKSMKKLAGACE